MKLRGLRLSRFATPMVLVAALVGHAQAQEAESEAAILLHGESGGAIAIESFASLRVIGVQGGILLRTGKEGELRYESRSRENRREERPVGMWRRSGTLELAPLPDAPAEPLWIEMAVPPGLSVELDLRQSAVEIAGLRSDLVVRGERLDLEARGIYGDVVVDAVNSGIRIDGVAGDVEVDGEALRVSIKNVSADLVVGLSGSEAELVEIRGAAEIDLERTALVGRQFEQAVRLSAAAGRVELHDTRKDADVRLVGAPLVLSGNQGRLTIDSDSDVRFDSVKASLTISGFGASVHGVGSTGPLEVSTSQAPVVLERHTGKVRIEGDGLTVELSEVKGEVSIETVSSEVSIQKNVGPIVVSNDFGDVRVEGTSQAVQIANLNGSVFATAIGGLIDVRGNGERFEVDWSEIGGEGQHSIVNEQGDVIARLPANSRCRVEVESSYGIVRSEIPTVKVSHDQRSASGVLGSAQQPLVQIRSSGDVLVTGPSAAADPTQ